MTTAKPNLKWIRKVGSDKLSAALLLLSLIGLAVIIRVHNVSPYLIYPDSYQNLMVAENIRHGFGLVGRLGEEGMWYPDTLWWTRPMYALLISIFSYGVSDMVGTAQTIALIAGVLFVPAVYFMLQKLWANRLLSLAGSGLAAVSYAATVWGGFVQTESFGILMMTLTLVSLFGITRVRYDGVMRFLAFGVLFGLAVLTRYEYIVLAGPIAYWLYIHRGSEWKLQVGAVAAGGFFVIALTMFVLGPVPFTFGTVIGSVKSFALPLALVVAAVTAGVYVLRRSSRTKERLIVSLPYTLPAVAAAALLIEGISNFVFTDFLICMLGLYGVVRLLQQSDQRAIGIFAVLSIAMLSVVYYEVNPDMQRYWTHTLPFLIIPAAYGGFSLGGKVMRSRPLSYRIVVSSLAVIALLIQLGFAWQGLHHYKEGLWFHSGYEEIAAKKVNTLLPKDVIVIASTPEPYALFTGASVHSIAPDAPYLYLPPGLESGTVAVINDESMRFYFPKFATYAETSLQRYKTHQFFVGEPFREQNHVSTEKKPVEVYVLPLRTLRASIDSAPRP